MIIKICSTYETIPLLRDGELLVAPRTTLASCSDHVKIVNEDDFHTCGGRRPSTSPTTGSQEEQGWRQWQGCQSLGRCPYSPQNVTPAPVALARSPRRMSRKPTFQLAGLTSHSSTTLHPELARIQGKTDYISKMTTRL